MKCLTCNLPLATILFGLLAVVRGEIKDKRQTVSVLPNEEDADAQVAATGFTDAVQGSSKYFQDVYSAQVKPEEIEFGHVRETPGDWEQRYAHVPAKDHYEFGHKRGNDHHFIERHEKGHPHAGEFKTKVRWGDKHGGYGEHYWDYNHAGHGGDDGHGDESNVQEVVEQYNDPQEATIGNYQTQRRKRQLSAGTRIRGDVEFINDGARDLILSGATGRHGGNYRREPGLYRAKREYTAETLVWNPLTGRLHDNNGNSYILQPVDY